VIALDATHFAVASLDLPAFTAPHYRQAHLALGVNVGTVDGSGGISFTDPIVAADGGQVKDQASAFLDKEWLAFDPSTRTLAISYTAFFYDPPAHCGYGEIRMNTAHVPADPATLSEADFQANPTVVVHPEESGSCSRYPVENEGAYVTLAPNGDAYVAWERNWYTNLFNTRPYTYIRVARIPFGASAPVKEVTASKNQVNSTPAGGLHSMDMQFIAGYNRGIGQDFPRIAWNQVKQKVDVVWNDASLHPLGDIFVKALVPDLSNNNNAAVYKVNDDDSYTLHFLPALTVTADGQVCTSWYDRRLSAPDSPLTDYFGECRIGTGRNTPDFRITTGQTDWTNTSSIIIPNFGDYTDAWADGNTVYYSWSDGRLGVPQPFVDQHAAG
jgi:hypothetical protein